MKPDRFAKALLKRSIIKMFGGWGYANILAARYRYLPSRAVGHRVRFMNVGTNLQATDGTQSIIFVVPERASRYIWKDGPLVVTENLWRKYVPNAEVVVDGGTVIDVGANIGEFTLAAVKRGATVHAFEPDATAYDALRLNVAMHAGAVAVPHGLGAKRERKEFFVATALADSSFVRPEQYNGSVQIELVPLDEYVASRGIRCIDLLKVEAEGYEPEVLAGARDSLKITKNVSVDCSPERQGKDTVEECKFMLQAANFDVVQVGWMLIGRQRETSSY